jgi:3-dehydroquinate synthase
MERSELIFTSQVAESFKRYCHENVIQHAVIIVDDNTEKYCLPLLQSSFPFISIPAGESFKNLETLQMVLKMLLELQLDRKSVVFNLGGGTVSDLGGFAASIYKRGIRYVNIPTTLLGMVDASIGGKTGVDFLDYKNYLGVFNWPETVIISEEFLKTLPEEELNSAWAEIIKTASVCSKPLMDLIVSGAALSDIIRLTAESKEMVCHEDFRDQGRRQLLNFGHTIGHAFESYRLSVGQPIMHGMAVAKGMLFEISLARQLGLLNENDATQISGLIVEKLGCSDLTADEWKALWPFLAGDKKNEGGDIMFSLPVGIGRGSYGIKVSRKDLKI